MASQFYAAALRDDPAMVGELAAGGYGRLHGRLQEHVYRHARLYRADELLQRSTGRGFDPTDYLDYLTEKYGALYGV